MWFFSTSGLGLGLYNKIGARRLTGHLLSERRTGCRNGVRMQQQMDRCFSEVNCLFYDTSKCRWHNIFMIFCYRILHTCRAYKQFSVRLGKNEKYQCKEYLLYTFLNATKELLRPYYLIAA